MKESLPYNGGDADCQTKPNGFQDGSFTWEGVTVKPPGKRGDLLKLLWNARDHKMEKSAVGSAIWAADWDEAKLSTTVNRLKNDLASLPWEPKISRDGFVVLEKRPE